MINETKWQATDTINHKIDITHIIQCKIHAQYSIYTMLQENEQLLRKKMQKSSHVCGGERVLGATAFSCCVSEWLHHMTLM